ncbi:MAG TPA: hypothetical protein VH257_14055 [Chloroflexota bacterium]|jgi:hypothetical protein|nr:hypothetical protein [Chloroflexota bacterium]
MASIPCFLLQPTDQFRPYLRVFTFPEEDACPSRGKLFRTLEQGHDALLPAGNAPPPPALPRTVSHGARPATAAGAYTDDVSGEQRIWEGIAALWPTHCVCGYAFREHDHRQFYYERLYLRSATGERYVLAETPVGSMWYDDRWGHDPSTGWLGPDGRCLVVKTPGGTCYLDREVDGHKVHLRVGTPPAISVATSLAVGRWRGWLREGALIDE